MAIKAQRIRIYCWNVGNTYLPNKSLKKHLINNIFFIIWKELRKMIFYLFFLEIELTWGSFRKLCKEQFAWVNNCARNQAALRTINHPTFERFIYATNKINMKLVPTTSTATNATQLYTRNRRMWISLCER